MPIIIGILLLAGFGACSADADPARETTIGLEVGQRPPELFGTLSTGDAFALDATGSPQVLVFYGSSECGLCRVQLDGMRANHPAYQREGARLIAITLDPPETSARFASEAGVGYAIVSVDTLTFARWGLIADSLSTPRPGTYLIADGVIRFRHIGRTAADRTTDATLISILAGMPDQ